MAGFSKIEWCDATFNNPWWGCERVSPACAHCYADTFSIRLGMRDLWAVTERDDPSGVVLRHPFRFFGDKHWDEPLKWARTLPAKLGRRPRVFCASMADVFEDRPELDEPRVRLYDLILRTPELDWLVLTKRPDVARAWLADGSNRRRIAGAHAHHFEDGDAAWDFAQSEIAHGPRNVWLGTSIENARFTYRADVLREIPAAVRFISAEPLLGSLFPTTPTQRDPMRRDGDAEPPTAHRGHGEEGSAARAADGRANIATAEKALPTRRAALDLSGIDWIIIGGESGPGARPFHLEHAREIIARCDPYQPVCCGNQDDGECCGDPEPLGAREQLPAVFVKQLGAKPVYNRTDGNFFEHTFALDLRDRKGGDMDEWPADLQIREFPTVLPALSDTGAMHL